MKHTHQALWNVKALTVFCLLTVAAYPQATQPPATTSAQPDQKRIPVTTETADSSADTVTLTPFEVSSARDRGYQATETLAGTRIRTDLGDVGSSISVITKEFMQDTGAVDTGTLLQYTTNAEVAGTRGTYSGLGNATVVDETSLLRGSGGDTNRVRGLASADNTRDFFVSDIPWDSYNVDRVDIQRGPNSILFGLGSPAGIVNYSLNSADFRTKGEVEARVGSWGTVRTSADFNQVIIPKQLAIRIDGLWSDQKYEQDEAYQKDKRIFGTVRYDPQLFNNPSFHTSIKAKFEHGDIKADRPRIVPPSDNITAFFRPVDNTSLNGGLGKVGITNGYAVGSNPAAQNPWLTGYGDRQQPMWYIDGATGQTYRIYGGYINNGFVDNSQVYRGSGNSAIGQRDSSTFFGIAPLQTVANNARLPGYQFGQYRQQSLQDPSIFDFYNHLIDGPTASQFEKWNAYNIDLTQTALDDRIGIEVSYDRQKYKRGGQSLLGNPAINIDVLQAFQDLAANPNYGRPYIAGGPGSGTSYESDREYVRASLFGELRASDFTHNEFLIKLLGKHRLNGVFSDEKYTTENLSWQMYANSLDWDAYWNQNSGLSSGFKTRPPIATIYLGPSLANANSAAGASLPGIVSPVTLNSGAIYHFNSTFKGGVNPADPWTVPANLLPIFDPTVALTQASNPANYVGWGTTFTDNVLMDSYGSNAALTTVAQKSFRLTKSWAGSWQGFLWNDAIVPTLGWRFDNVAGKSVTAAPVVNNRGSLNLSPDTYKFSDTFPANQIFKNHSTSGGVVVHINKLLDKWDPLPFDLSLSYNRSDNFQVTDTRRDFFGKPIGNPTGKTKEYGVTIGTKDGKYSLKVTHYETSLQGATTALDLTGLASTITQGIKFRNVFLYQLSNYDWPSREQTVNTPGQRYFWTPAYIDSKGRPVADLTGLPTPVPAGAVLETQAQADAHRDASINAWNSIQKFLQGQGFFGAWNYTPTTQSALTDRSTYAATLTTVGSTDGKPIPAAQYMPDILSLANYSPTAPSGLATTADSESKGYEIELTANPTPDWRLTFNAAKTTAVRENVGGPALDALVSYMDTQMSGVAGDMRQFNGNYVPTNEVRQNYATWRAQYTLLKLQEDSAASELRKWRFNVFTAYDFSHGWVKGVGVGGGYRWQDKVVIGYPVIAGANGQASFDLSKPYYGPSEGGADLFASYHHKLTRSIDWKIQLNVTDVGKKNALIPVSVEPDGHTWAAVRTAPVEQWMLTNSLTF